MTRSRAGPHPRVPSPLGPDRFPSPSVRVRRFSGPYNGSRDTLVPTHSPSTQDRSRTFPDGESETPRRTGKRVRVDPDPHDRCPLPFRSGPPVTSDVSRRVSDGTTPDFWSVSLGPDGRKYLSGLRSPWVLREWRRVRPRVHWTTTPPNLSLGPTLSDTREGFSVSSVPRLDRECSREDSSHLRSGTLPNGPLGRLVTTPGVPDVGVEGWWGKVWKPRWFSVQGGGAGVGVAGDL